MDSIRNTDFFLPVTFLVFWSKKLTWTRTQKPGRQAFLHIIIQPKLG